ncbi:AAA family ATPase [Pseudophaeobacter sp. TrK17]|uniref:AAA family ATPase n=1 Tax=Pseudophaeobacter sp. TrK17 TaxID=2815167 RepID=UPI0035CF594A
MTFRNTHQPKSINDLVFKDPHVEQTIRDYGAGKATKHLILHGPVGSGKSSAAKMIVAERCGQPFDELSNITVNGRIDKDRKDWADIERDWDFQRMVNSAGRAYTIIDEVDECSKKLRGQLDTLIETDRKGTVIMTTNNLHDLDDWFCDRCAVVRVDLPSISDVERRVQDILRAEGLPCSPADVQTLLTNFKGSLRQMIDWVEGYVRHAAAPNVGIVASSGRIIRPSSPNTSINGTSI